MMTAALSHRTAFATPGLALTAKPRAVSSTCVVRLIDRRTGQIHRVNGSPLVVYTRNPDAAVADLLDGRDAEVWEARVEPIGGRA
jgi:hypothetical protein